MTRLETRRRRLYVVLVGASLLGAGSASLSGVLPLLAIQPPPAVAASR